MSKAACAAVQDHRAVLRYLTHHSSNWGIDPTSLFVGGESAGAITTLISAYWDQDEATAFAPNAFDTMGGLDNSGNELTDSWTLRRIINNCDAINSLTVLDNNELLPIVSFHDDGDCVVPFDTAPAIGCFCSGFFSASGSNQIHTKYGQEEASSQLNAVQLSLGHCSYPVAKIIDHSACLMKQTLCGTLVYTTNHDLAAAAVCANMGLDLSVNDTYPEDLNNDQIVNTKDLLQLLTQFGQSCE